MDTADLRSILTLTVCRLPIHADTVTHGRISARMTLPREDIAMMLTARTAGKLSSSIIGREILVNGIGFGRVSDYRVGTFRTTIYSGGRIRKVRNSAHVVY